MPLGYFSMPLGYFSIPLGYSSMPLRYFSMPLGFQYLHRVVHHRFEQGKHPPGQGYSVPISEGEEKKKQIT